MKTPLRFALLALLALWHCSGGADLAWAQVPVVIDDPGFGLAGGQIAGSLDLDVLDGPPEALTIRLGSSPWYAKAGATALGNLGFRPGIQTNQPLTSSGVASIKYTLGGLLGLVGAEMPEADLWQTLAGRSLLASTTYTLSLDLNAGVLLNAAALADRGFGLGISLGADSSVFGSFFWDSQSSPGSLSISPVSGTTERLSLTFTTGATVSTQDIAVVVFAGRGSQGLQLTLLNDYAIDNVSLTSVPEPGGGMLAALGGLGILLRARLRRR